MTVSAQLAELAGYLARRNPPASEEAIERFVARIGFKPPGDYLEFMRQADGAYGEGESLVFLYSLAEAIERTEQTEGLPAKMIAIGSDGGHVQYLLDGRGKTVQIVSLSVYDESAQSQKLGPTLEKALAKLQKERQKAELLMAKRSKLPPLSPTPAAAHGEVARLACREGKEFAICSIRFSGDSTHLAVAGDFGIQVWSVEGWRLVAHLPLADDVGSTASDLYLDTVVGTVRSAHCECILDQSFRDRRVLHRHDQATTSTHRCLTNDARYLMRTLADGSLAAVDTRSGAERQLAPADGLHTQALARAGNRILALRYDSELRQKHGELWQPAEARREHAMTLPQFNDSSGGSAPLDDGRLIRIGFAGQQFVNLRTATHEDFELPLPHTTGTLGQCVAVPGTSHIAVAMNEAVAIFDLNGYSLVETFDFGDGGGPTLIEVSPDARWLVTTGIRSLSRRQFAVRVWRIG